jgi:23S rRNA (uracil1939-C5)-methyltransferase
MDEPMNDKMVELTIEDLAFDGKSVAHRDGKVVFLDRGLPGETVLAEIVRSKPRHDKAVVHEILTKCDDRIEPTCSHFGICGGCTWQDLAYQKQLEFKRKQVVACLERIGGLEDVKVFDVVGAVELYRYRNKMEFSFNVAKPDGFTLGLHHRGRFDEIFDLEHCYLQSPLANRVVAFMRDFVTRENIPVYNVFDHTGFMRFLMIRECKRTPQLMINIVTNYGEIPEREKLIAELTSAFPEITTVIHNQNGQKSNIAIGETEQVLYGPGYMEERLFDQMFRIRANSFFQTNTIQTETLYRMAFEILEPEGVERVLDLYCGTGSIGLLVSSHVQDVVGVELVEDAITVARQNAEVNEIANIKFFQGHVKEFLKTEDATREPFSIIILDPPRAGLHPKALKRVLRLTPKKLLYISCNPATFARDAADIIKAGYTLDDVHPIDMFPHTMHIELVSLFRRID